MVLICNAVPNKRRGNLRGCALAGGILRTKKMKALNTVDQAKIPVAPPVHRFLLRNFFVALCCCSMLAGCSDDKVRDQARKQALQNVAAPEPEIGHSTPNEQLIVGALQLTAASAEASKGEEVCVAIKANDFREVVSMQYTLKWDPAVLKYTSLRKFELPGLSQQNFGTHLTDQGLVTHAWFDLNVKGISLPDGATLYELCFEVVGHSGSKSTIQFINEPTSIEISNAASAFLELKQVPGVIKVR